MSSWFLVAVSGTNTNYFLTVVSIGHNMMDANIFITANGIFKPAGTLAVSVIL